MCQLFAGQDPYQYASQTRRLRLNGQSTSIRLENAFWQTLDDIAASEGLSTPCFISKLHTEVLAVRGEQVNFTSLLRCTCLKFMEVSMNQLCNPPVISDTGASCAMASFASSNRILPTRRHQLASC